MPDLEHSGGESPEVKLAKAKQQQENEGQISQAEQTHEGDAEGANEGNAGKRTDEMLGREKLYTGGRSQKEMDELASDPAHGGKIEAQGIKEREIGLALEERGDLGKIVRDPQADKGAEFIDTTTSQKWDVKSFVSYPNGHTSPRKGAFTVDRAMKTIQKEFSNGHNVIIDKRELTPEHVQQLKQAIEQQGFADRIKWYP